MIQIFEYFKLNNNDMRVMGGRFESNTTAMRAMQVFKLSQGGLICVRPCCASLCEYMQVFKYFKSFFDIHQCLKQMLRK